MIRFFISVFLFGKMVEIGMCPVQGLSGFREGGDAGRNFNWSSEQLKRWTFLDK
jgi:hypothetical protein